MALVLSQNQIEYASELLMQNHPVALPSETVYGLAARLSSDVAMTRVFELKARPTFDPLIVHVLDLEMARPLVLKFGQVQRVLAEKFWPGPLTLLFEKSQVVSDLCTAGSGFVAIRCPENVLFRKAIELVGEPLAAPSANRFKGVSPVDYSDVLTELGRFGLSAVVDGGRSVLGLESTVIKVDEDQKLVQILRPGAVSKESLKEALPEGFVVEQATSFLDQNSPQLSPGTAAKHYSPSVPVEFTDTYDLNNVSDTEIHLFVLEKDFSSLELKPTNYIVLGKTDSEAAANLFRVLRRIDQEKNYSKIIAHKSSDSGLGLAINDRLQRAAGLV